MRKKKKAAGAWKRTRRLFYRKKPQKKEPSKAKVKGRWVYRNNKGRFTKRGFYYRSIGLHRKKSSRRVRAVRPLEGWESVDRWKATLESKYPGLIYSEPIPSAFQFANNSLGETWLWTREAMPGRKDFFRLALIWLVVENTKNQEFYLMIQTHLIAPTIDGERLFDVCLGMYQKRAEMIENKTDYLTVREWAAWSGGLV